ncbi:MAG: transporter substrate-binding domain-containing protein [Oscillospiraceae bacterium]|nr:transporter substrate-binding domain-containing protein [Oscillospiraceae bacterium]
MKKIIALALSAILLLGLLAGCQSSEEGPGKNTYGLTTLKEGYLTVLTSPDYAPYEFYALDADGNPSLAGFDMELAQYIADYLGLTLEVIPMSFNGIVGEMAANGADLAMAGLSPDPDRETAMDFSDIYYAGKQAFVTVESKASQFTDLASTNNASFSIAAQTGTIQMDLAAEFSPNAQFVSLPKATDIIAELVSGKLDGAYVEWDVAEAYKQNYPELTIVCEVPYEADGNVIGVAKGNADLLKYVNEALNKCVDEGTFATYVANALELAAGDNYQGLLDDEGNIPVETTAAAE